MEELDKRAPFTATGGVIPPEFRNIKTPCYILDENATRALRKNNREWLNEQDVRCFWRRKHSVTMTVMAF